MGLRIRPVDQQYPEASVSSPGSRSAWARLIARLYEVDPLICHRIGVDHRTPAGAQRSRQPAVASTEGCPSSDQDREGIARAGPPFLELNLPPPRQPAIALSPLVRKMPQLGFTIRQSWPCSSRALPPTSLLHPQTLFSPPSTTGCQVPPPARCPSAEPVTTEAHTAGL